MSLPIHREHNKSASRPHMLGSMQRLTSPMRRFAPDEEIDYVIVGVGAGGGVLLQRLARAGFRVLGFEAGPFWDTERDWVSDEAGSHQLYWKDLRITGGTIRSPLAAIIAAKALAAVPSIGRHSRRGFIHRTFAFIREDGVGADWPSAL